MAYTPPAGNAVNFDDLNGPYTPPAGNAVIFDDLSSGNFTVTLGGQQATVQQALITAGAPGGSYSRTLAGQQAAALRGDMAIPGAVLTVALVGQEAGAQQGTIGFGYGLALATNIRVIMEQGVIRGHMLTGLIEWSFGYVGLITISGTPKITASANSSGFPGVFSTGGEEAFGGRRYYEIAITGREQTMGIGNQWRSMGTQYPLGLHPSEDAFSWGLQMQANGTLRTMHAGVAIAQGAFTYVPGAPIMLALDFDQGFLWFGYNGTWVGGGNPTLNLNPTYTGVTGFPHPVLVYGTLGGNVVFPETDTAVLHLTGPSQQFLPADFQPWQDSEGVDVTYPLTGQSARLLQSSFIREVFTDPDRSVSLYGLPLSIQLNGPTKYLGYPDVRWNPNDKSVWIDLTDDNYGAIASPNTPDQNTHLVRATLGRAKNSGKYYFEVTIAQVQEYLGGYHRGPGLGLSRYNSSYEVAENEEWFASLTYAYNSAASVWQLAEKSFNLAQDGFGGGPGPEDPIYGFGQHYDWIPNPFVPGRVMQVAVDLTAGKIWFGYNGKWFNSSNGANPASGTLPQYTNLNTYITNFTEYPSAWPDFVFGYTPPSSNIGHFKLSSFAFPPPAGFLPWQPGDPLDIVVWPSGQQGTVQQGAFGVVVDTGVAGVPIGQAVATGQGALGVVSTNALVLTGQQVAVLQGTFKLIYGSKLVGQAAQVQRGTFGFGRGVALKGQQVIAQRGMFAGLNIGFTLTGQTATVLRGTVRTGLGISLAGQALQARYGALQRGLAVLLKGRAVTVRRGALLHGLAVSLPGGAVAVSRGLLGPGVTRWLTGQQVTVQLGAPGIQCDGFAQLRGLQVRIVSGELPILPVSPDWQLWVRLDDNELYVEEEPAI